MTPYAFVAQVPVCTTRELAHACAIDVGAASRLLRRHAATGPLVRVVRGVWANRAHPHFHAHALVPYVLGREHGYVSFLTALQRHGALSQIPHHIFVATTGHGRLVQTPVATFQLLRVQPRHMQAGITWMVNGLPYGMATPEKALLDCLYLATRRGRSFAHLPELDLAALDHRRLLALLHAHAFALPIRHAIRARLAALFGETR